MPLTHSTAAVGVAPLARLLAPKWIDAHHADGQPLD